MMAYNTRKLRSVKEEVTTGLFNHVKKTNRKPFKCYLCLPSTKSKDVKEALSQGVINLNTKIIAIEHNPKHLKSLKSSLTKLGFKHSSRVVLNMDICDITADHLKAACKKLGVAGIDLFYLDSCNCLIDKFQNWLEKVVSQTQTQNAVIITNVLAARAIWDLTNYKNSKHFLYYNERFGHIQNKWAPYITTCLKERLKTPISFCVGYKESGKATPMVLCVNQQHLLRETPSQNKIQNLGYKI